MSCNTKTSLAAVIDAVNAQLNNNYVDRDDPRIDQGVFTEPTIRGGLMLDEAAKLDFCGYVTECGQREPFGKQWVDRPLYPHNTLVSYEDEGEIKSRWQDIDDVVAGTEIGESYIAFRQGILTGGLITDTIVTVTASGVGKVERNQSAKNADQVSVKDYGALGDGTGLTVQSWIDSGRYASLEEIQVDYPHCNRIGATIDRVCIQEALNRNSDVFIPEGVYLLDTAVSPRSNSKLHGTFGSILTYPNGHNFPDWKDRSLIYIGQDEGEVHGVEVCNLTLDGNRHLVDQTTSHFHCVSVYGARIGEMDYSELTDIHIHHVNFLRPTLDGIYIKWSDGVTVENCYAFDAGRSAYVVVGARNVRLLNNRGRRARNSYVDMETHTENEDTSNVLVEGNIFIADELCNAVGFGMTGPGTQNHNSVINNYFELNRRLGDFGGSYNNISNNIVYCQSNDDKYGSLNSTSSLGCTVKGNVITITSTDNPGDLIGLLRLRGAKYLTVEGNHINAANILPEVLAINISISSATPEYFGNKIIGNIINGNFWGISIGSEDSLVADNVINGCVDVGIRSTATNSRVENNEVTGSATGLDFRYCERNIAISNKLSNCTTGIDIYTNGDNSSILGNDITGGGRGILVRNSKNIEVADNTVEGVSDTAILTNTLAERVRVRNNNLKNNMGYPITLGGANSSATGNRILYDVDETVQPIAIEIDRNNAANVYVSDNIVEGYADIVKPVSPPTFIIPPILLQQKDITLVDGALVTTDRVYSFRQVVNALNIKIARP